MAEKEETEGRCPACCAIYEKEKIVAMQANCERTMKKNSNRKTKPPKTKPKSNEVKKDLTNVRVIQRKMAYVIGLPLSLADEDVLVRKEYFGQYGKVVKVSLSRTVGGAIQQFINDTCSVYITYSKEEEALRCIQSVHGFFLEGRLLRASFGTAKYCHAWLKNMPCNNLSCLYLHSVGADEDSFGKDEVAAVHTRSRVQQIVGATSNTVKRSGTELPPPADDIYKSTSTFTDKSNSRSAISDAAPSANTSGDLSCPLPSNGNEEDLAVPNKMTTFVDIVGRSNCAAAPERNGNIPEDVRTLNLSSELSSVTANGDVHAGEQFSGTPLFKIPSSSGIRNSFFQNVRDEPLREDLLLSGNQGSKVTHGSSHGDFFLHPSYSANTPEDCCGPPLLPKSTHNANGFSVDHYRDDEASLPLRCVNSVLDDSCQEIKFQNSAKSDRIYRSSKSFSNEEIVEHLRRINDDNLIKGEDNSALDVISNIMSIDLDSCEDSLEIPNGLPEFLDETDGLGGSSWDSLNSDQSGFGSQTSGSIFPDYGDSKEQYLCKPQYPASRAQNLVPPGFSLPSRDPPPGFSTSDRAGCLSRASSGSRLVNASSLSNTMSEPSLIRRSSSIHEVDFFDPAMLSCGQGKPTSVLKTSGFEVRPASAPRLTAFEEESSHWLLNQESKLSQIFAPQSPSTLQELSYTGHMGNGLSRLDNIYGLSSRLVNEHQNCDPSLVAQMAQQKYANELIFNTNGYRPGLDEVMHKGGATMQELGRNERLGGANKYSPGYGDLMFSSGDVYTGVFRLL